MFFLLSISLLHFSLFLSKKRKNRVWAKEGGAALDSLEAGLKEKMETLSFSVEQKTKAMKLRDKKVGRHDGR